MVESRMANISSLIYYDKLFKTDMNRSMPFYPDCNMRFLNEVNMTTLTNTRQEFTMEEIIKNYKSSKEKFDLSSPMAIVLYEMTSVLDYNKYACIISANIVEHDDGKSIMGLPDRFAAVVRIATVKQALERLKLDSTWIQCESSSLLTVKQM